MTAKKHKNNKSYWVEETPEKLSYICETLHNENMKLKDKLTKYKRAFKILKDELVIDVSECCEKHKKVFNKDYKIITYSHQSFINKEQGELLEELMNNE